MTDPVSQGNNIKVTTLLPEHAGAVAELHISGIHTGFISSLGIDFVTALYYMKRLPQVGSVSGLLPKAEGRLSDLLYYEARECKSPKM